MFSIVFLAIASFASGALAAGAEQGSDYEKAVSLYNRGKYEQAVPLFKKQIETDPSPEAYFMLGYSLYKLGRHEEARKYFSESYLVEPEYSPTPDLEKKLNRRLQNARPGGADEKVAVPEGGLPPEAEGLDPSQYKVIDKSERLKLPETSQSTDTFTPKKAPAKKPAKKPAPQAAAKPQQQPVTEAKPVADTAPAPAAPVEAMPEQAPQPAPVPAEQMPVETQQAPKPAPRHATPARPAMPEGMPTPGDVGSLIVMLSAFLLPLIAIIALTYLLYSFALYKIAKKLDVPMPILAFVPIAQMWTLTSAAGLGVIWFILIFLFGFPAIYAFMKIAENMGKSKVYGLVIALTMPLGIGLLLFLLLALKGGTAASAAGMSGGNGAIPDLGGEPELDLPDMDDMGFDMEDDSFAADTGFGSEEGIGEHSDDFGTGGEETDEDDFDMDLEPGEDDFDTADEEHKADGFDLGENAGGGDDDGFGFDFDDKS